MSTGTRAAIWLARLSEGWCPREEHGRLGGGSGCWCTQCQARWTISDGAPVGEVAGLVRARIQLVLTADSAPLVFAVIDEHKRRLREATSAQLESDRVAFGSSAAPG